MPMRPYACHLAPTYGALTYAAKVGDVVGVEAQFRAGMNFRAKGGGNGREAVHFAAEGGQKYTMKSLTDHGADVRAKDYFGWEPVHYAASNGYGDLIVQLKRLGANIRAKDSEGKEPAHYAAEWGHMETLRTLRGLGADMHAHDNEWKEPRDYATNSHVIEYLNDVERKVLEARNWLATTSDLELSRIPNRESSAREGEPLLGPQYKYKGEHTVRGMLQVLGEDLSGTNSLRRDRLMNLKGSLENTLNRTGSLDGLSMPRQKPRARKPPWLDP